MGTNRKKERITRNSNHPPTQNMSIHSLQRKHRKMCKPPFTNCQLIAQCLLDTLNNKATKSTIVKYICNKHPYYMTRRDKLTKDVSRVLWKGKYFERHVTNRYMWMMKEEHVLQLTENAMCDTMKKMVLLNPSRRRHKSSNTCTLQYCTEKNNASPAQTHSITSDSEITLSPDNGKSLLVTNDSNAMTFSCGSLTKSPETTNNYVGQERRSIPFIEFGTENNVHTNWQLNSVNPLTETASCPTNATSFGIVGNAPNISLPEEDPLTIEHARLFHQQTSFTDETRYAPTPSTLPIKEEKKQKPSKFPAVSSSIIDTIDLVDDQSDCKLIFDDTNTVDLTKEDNEFDVQCVCPLCGAVFDRDEALGAHVKIHSLTGIVNSEPDEHKLKALPSVYFKLTIEQVRVAEKLFRATTKK